MARARRDTWDERLVVLKLLREGDRLPTVVYLLIAYTAALVPAGLAIASGVLIDRVPEVGSAGLDSDEGRLLVQAVVFLMAMVVAERVLPTCADLAKYRVVRSVDAGLRRRVLRALARTERLGDLERADVHDNLALMRGGLFGTPGAAAAASIGISGRYVQTIASLLIVGWFAPVLAVATFVVVVAIRRRWHVAFGELADALIGGAGQTRRADYFADLALGAGAAKELRLFGLLGWIRGRQREEWEDSVRDSFDIRTRLRRSANLELTMLGVIYAVTFVLAARGAVEASMSLGALAALLQSQFSAAQLTAPTEADYATSSGIAAMRALAALEELPSTAAAGDAPAPVVAGHTIRFESVDFSYPASTRPTVAGLDLTIEGGRSLAIVGLNGAGKTTIVKLLCGLYRPDAGRIVIDGTDLADLDAGAWRSRLSVIYQDFIHYELTARDNVTVGAVARRDDAPTLARALDRAGATALVDGLPNGQDTILCPHYEGGVELSGGQWQRIALARALFAVECGAQVLVLDEPSANLDVRAEAELFEHFLELTAGVTSVIISHRFSTVRRADRIAVLDEGAIVELGSHEELLALGGEYARMFKVQAERFTDQSPNGAPVTDLEGERVDG